MRIGAGGAYRRLGGRCREVRYNGQLASCPKNNLAFAAGQLAVFSRCERRAYLN